MAYEKGKKRKGTAKSNAIGPMLTDDWEAEEDLRAVCRASLVNKDPERMKKCQTLAKKKLEESKKRLDEAEMMVEMGGGKTD